jgi:AraC-like DNA-binding protein
MSAILNGSTFHVRQRWFGVIVDALQIAAGRVVLLDRIDAQVFLNTLPQSFPPPRCTAERLILHGQLLQFAAESGEAMHARAHRATRNRQCPFVPEVFLKLLWKPRGRRPLEAFHGWVDAFFKRFREVHPVPAATRAAHLIREHHTKAWDVIALSQRVHATAAQLTRDFRREYGMSIRTYQRRISLVIALPRVREEKVEAIALELGYRSRKNFYLAFKRATGLTPTAFRELPLHQAQRIIDDARMTANAARPAPRMRAEWSSHATRPPRAVAADASHS